MLQNAFEFPHLRKMNERVEQDDVQNHVEFVSFVLTML